MFSHQGTEARRRDGPDAGVFGVRSGAPHRTRWPNGLFNPKTRGSVAQRAIRPLAQGRRPWVNRAPPIFGPEGASARSGEGPLGARSFRVDHPRVCDPGLGFERPVGPDKRQSRIGKGGRSRRKEQADSQCDGADNVRNLARTKQADSQLRPDWFFGRGVARSGGARPSVPEALPDP